MLNMMVRTRKRRKVNKVIDRRWKRTKSKFSFGFFSVIKLWLYGCGYGPWCMCRAITMAMGCGACVKL